MVKGSNIFYGWVIVGISTLVFALVQGVNDSFSVVAFLVPFDWTGSYTVSFHVSMTMLALAVVCA